MGGCCCQAMAAPLLRLLRGTASRAQATGTVQATWESARECLAQQAAVGLLLGAGLSAGGFVRVYASGGDLDNAGAISLSLFLIVMVSVELGTALPFALTRVRAGGGWGDGGGMGAQGAIVLRWCCHRAAAMRCHRTCTLWLRVRTQVGVDPANAGTSIQVLMDILGVLITCVTCNHVLQHLAMSLA